MDILNETPELFAESFVENGFGDKYLYSINRETFNKLGSYGVYSSEYGEDLFHEHTLYIIIGTDSGLLLSYVQRKGIPTGSRYLFVELPYIIEKLETSGILENSHEEITCVPYTGWQSAAINYKIIEYFYIQRTAILQSMAARDALLDDYVELSWKVETELSRHRWEVSASLGQEDFARCTLLNLADDIQPATGLRGAFSGQTAALLAGGPSLDESLPWLLENREKLVVIAVYRVAKRLLEVGLVPDFVMAVDPQEHAFGAGREMLNLPEQVVFIHANHVAPILLGQWHGQSLYLGQPLPWSSRLNVESLPMPGPTVTNTALAVAHAMGFSQIVFAGLDLCFSREGFSHAKGSVEHQAGPRFDMASLQVETNGGWYANTAADYATAIKNIALQAKHIQATGTKLINPSPNSARIELVEHKPLSEVVLPANSVDVAGTVVVHTPPPTAKQKLKHYRDARREIAKALHHVHEIEKLANEALDCNGRMYGDDGFIKDSAAKKRMDQIEKVLNRKHRQFSRLTKTLGVRDFLKTTKPFDGGDMTAEEAAAMGETYYKAYLNGATRLLSMLDAARLRLEARMEEAKEKPNWPDVLEQWRTAKHYRRAILWRDRNPSAHENLPSDIRSELEALARQFHDEMQASDTYFSRLVKRRRNLTAAQKRARILLKNRQIEELEKLLEGLVLHPSAEESQPYRLLVEAYLAELRMEYDTALRHYHTVIELQESASEQPLLEDALVRISQISLELNDSDNALASLECLSLLSPIYQPHYAELLRLSGQTIAAIDVYNDYITRFPDNLYALLKLAHLYISINVRENAALLLQHVLDKHPDNEAATKMLESIA